MGINNLKVNLGISKLSLAMKGLAMMVSGKETFSVMLSEISMISKTSSFRNRRSSLNIPSGSLQMPLVQLNRWRCNIKIAMICIGMQLESWQIATSKRGHHLLMGFKPNQLLHLHSTIAHIKDSLRPLENVDVETVLTIEITQKTFSKISDEE